VSHYKPYPKYKPSGLAWLERVPEHWDVMRLRYIANFTNSNVDKKSYEGQRPVKLCNYVDVYNNEHITATLPFMDATASDAEIKTFALKTGDVLITKDSEDPWDIGIPAIVTDEIDGVICGYHLTMIRTHDPNISAFLHRSLQSHPTKAYFFVESPGITRYGLSQDAIGDIKVCRPPEKECVLVASWISRETSRIDVLISKKSRFIELLKEKRRALIANSITKGLDPNVKMRDSGSEWIGQVPEHWAVSRLGHFSSVENGTTPSKANEAYWTDGDIAWVGSGEVNQVAVTEATEYITKLALSECSLRLLPKGTVVVGMVGQGKTRGLAAILEIEAAINQNLAAVCVGPKLLGKFLLNVFVAGYEWLREGGRGSNQAALNCELLGQFRLAVPPMDEQQEILTYITERSERIDVITSKTQRTIDLLKERRSALITAAVTGRIDLRGAA
jgi:type I restriction enzyme S subunit